MSWTSLQRRDGPGFLRWVRQDGRGLRPGLVALSTALGRLLDDYVRTREDALETWTAVPDETAPETTVGEVDTTPGARGLTVDGTVPATAPDTTAGQLARRLVWLSGRRSACAEEREVNRRADIARRRLRRSVSVRRTRVAGALRACVATSPSSGCSTAPRVATPTPAGGVRTEPCAVHEGAGEVVGAFDAHAGTSRQQGGEAVAQGVSRALPNVNGAPGRGPRRRTVGATAPEGVPVTSRRVSRCSAAWGPEVSPGGLAARVQFVRPDAARDGSRPAPAPHARVFREAIARSLCGLLVAAPPASSTRVSTGAPAVVSACPREVPSTLSLVPVAVPWMGVSSPDCGTVRGALGRVVRRSREAHEARFAERARGRRCVFPGHRSASLRSPLVADPPSRDRGSENPILQVVFGDRYGRSPKRVSGIEWVDPPDKVRGSRGPIPQWPSGSLGRKAPGIALANAIGVGAERRHSIAPCRVESASSISLGYWGSEIKYLRPIVNASTIRRPRRAVWHESMA